MVQQLYGYNPSVSIVFGGAVIALFITRIARGRIYLDWILSGLFCSGTATALDS